MIKLAELLSEKHMTPAQKKKRGQIFDKLVASGMSKDKAGPIATSKAMAEATFTDKHDDNPKLKGGQKDLPDEIQAKIVAKEGESNLTPLQQYIYDYEVEISGEDFANEELENIKKLNNIDDVKKYYGSYRGWAVDKDLKYEFYNLIKTLKSKKLAEGEDHEVSMAQNSLKSIISSASQLMSKLGDDERNIPGWIQDHIAKAENYIEQAAQGFHELKGEMSENVKIRKEPAGFRGVEKIVSSKDKAAVEQAVAQIEREYPSAGYGTNVKKMYQTPSGVWVAVVRHSTTSD